MGTSARAGKRNNRRRGLDPAIAAILPTQGEWSEADYFWLANRSNRLIEYSDGWIEVLPTPTDQHQTILLYLYELLLGLVRPLGGKVLVAPLRLRVKPRKFREPDLLFLRRADDPRRSNAYWEGADLVLEVVSPDDPARDLKKKRREYAETGIPEYWIVNAQTECITVLRLEMSTYIEHGVFGRGARATSALFEGWEIDVAAVFDAE